MPFVIACSLLILFFITYKVNRTGLLSSFILTCFLFFVGLMVFIVLYNNESESAKVVFWVLFFPVIIIIAYGIYILIPLLLLNAMRVFRKESRSLANSLTLIMACGLIVVVAVSWVTDIGNMPKILRVLMISSNLVMGYCAFHLSQYIVGVFLCNFSRPRKNQDYIIVLGCGLSKGNVTPLLAKRVDRAIAFYRRQEKDASPPKLVFSGGQGADESRSEAAAMAEYAQSCGITAEHLLLEDKSTTTLENMMFSKKMIQEDFGGDSFKAIYATSNYHLLRAGIYARRAGLKINGIGAKTAFYYLPNAILREYVAYLSIYKKRSIIIGALVFLCSAVVMWLMQ